MQLTLAASLEATQGYTTPEVAHAYTRVHELCQHVEETPQLFSVLVRLRQFYTFHGELQTAQQLAEQLLQFAQRQPDAARLQEAHWALGQILRYLGEFVPARARLEQSMACYTPQPLSSQAGRDAAGTQIACLVIAAWISWRLGYPAQARDGVHEALRLARELAHPFTLAVALWGVAMIHLQRGEVQAAHEWTEALMALTSEQGFPGLGANGTLLQGEILVRQGQAEAGIALVRQILTSQLESVEETARPSFLARTAKVYGAGGQVEEGLRLLAEALVLVDQTGVRESEVEVYRLKGELLLAQSSNNHAAEAETCFHQALDVARHQQAKSLELRAATSLARLWQSQGKRDEAPEDVV